ncbi:pectate lyase [soil metagenome]
MRKKLLLIALSLWTIAIFASSSLADSSSEVANIGWATQSGGTKGGNGAAKMHIYTVHNRTELIQAIDGVDTATGRREKKAPKIIIWAGTIDMTDGKAFADHEDQASRGEIKLTPNTTIIGVGSTAYLPNGWFMIRGVENVIIRNIKVTNPCDVSPVWDAGDDGGNYNSEFDGLTIDKSTHVWIDHMLFSDSPYTDDKQPPGNSNKSGVKMHIQCHDGAVDIKDSSDFVTVSNTKFELHLKNNLIGHSDKKIEDIGHQTITFANNWFQDIGQRTPRVRFGKVHVFNNYYSGSKTDRTYPHLYSIGTGIQSQIISDNNVFEITGATAGKCDDVILNPHKGNPDGSFKDSGSTINGSVLAGCTSPSAVNWTVPYTFTKLPTDSVKQSVESNAGVGKIKF